MQTLRTLWIGAYSLPRSFWLFYCLGTILVFAIVTLGVGILSVIAPSLRPLFFIVHLFLVVGYWIIATVGVWNSAGDRKSVIAFWRYAARFIVGLYMLAFLAKMSGGGAVALMNRILS